MNAFPTLTALALLGACSGGQGRSTTTDLLLTNANLVATTVTNGSNSLTIGSQHQPSMSQVEATLNVLTDETFSLHPALGSFRLMAEWRGTLSASADGSVVYFDAADGFRYYRNSGPNPVVVVGDPYGPRTFTWRYVETQNGYELDGTPSFSYWNPAPVRIEAQADFGDTLLILRVERR